MAQPRLATLADLPTIRALIPLSVRGLSAGHYVEAARAAGFRALELGSTLNGVALYENCGFTALGRIDVPMPGGEVLPIVRMRMELAGG